MNQPSVAYRAAQPTFDEGLVFARYLDQAAEGFFRLLFGRRAMEIIATAFIEPGHDLSYQHVTFAVMNDVIVGMASSYSAEQHLRSSDQPLKQAVGHVGLRMLCICLLCAPMFRFLDTQADGDFYVQAITVDKEQRGKGIGSALLDSIEDRARAIGSTRLALDVSAKNEKARRLYQCRGMTVVSQWPKLKVIPRVVVRMTKPL